MKKTNPGIILLMIAIVLAIGILSGMLLGLFFGGNWCMVITIPLAMICFLDLTDNILFPIAQRTMRKGLEKNHFGPTTTFINKHAWTIWVMLCIDENDGRVAFTSATNPFKFQMADARELTKIRSTYSRGPFGGTRYVFFEFYHGNSRLRFPTFATRNMWTIASSGVQEAMKTGDKICNLLLKFNPDGDLTADKKDNITMPFVKAGIPGTVFAGISVYFTVGMLVSMGIVSAAYENWKADMLNGLSVYVSAFVGLVCACIGLAYGIKGIKFAKQGPVRGLGFSKLAVIMSSVCIALIVCSMLLFLFAG